jgi:cytoskeletal protein RodZ
MRKKRLKKILIWVGSLTIVFIVVGLFAANYAINRVLDSFSSVTNEMEKQLEQTPTVSDSSHISPSTTPVPSTASSNNQISESSQPVIKPEVTVSPTNTQTYVSDISAEKAKVAKDDITLKEKSEVMSVLLKKLSAEDINYIVNLSSGGLTDAEKGEAKKVIVNKLSEEEYNQLIEIAAKYGLSQGVKIKK